MEDKRPKTIFLFDVNGTLTHNNKSITPEIQQMLSDIKNKVYIGFVSGSDMQKQLGNNVLNTFDYSFPENGLCFYKGDLLVEQKNMIDQVGEEVYQKLINFTLAELSKITLPFKRGNFIEYRNSLINISPCGRNCNDDERRRFYEYDSVTKVRESMIETLKENFDRHDLHFSIGGKISIDCFPKKWDKRWCIKHLNDEAIFDIYFFGDMTHLGGNDFEIFEDERVKGISVDDPEDTVKKVYERIGEIN